MGAGYSKLRMKKIIAFYFFCSIWINAFSQETKNGHSFSGNEKLKKEFKYLALSGGLSASSYFGDLRTPGFEKLFHTRSTDVSLSATLDLKISKRIVLSSGIAWVRLTSDDFYLTETSNEEGLKNYVRNLSFRNDLFEWSMIARYQLKKNSYSYQERPFFTPYIFLGVGIFYHNPKARIPEFNLRGERFENSGQWTSLRPLGTEGQLSPNHNIKTYSYFQPVIPVGLGITFKINPLLDLSFETSFRYTFTDYLDDVSLQYVDLGSLDGDLAKALSYRSGEVNSSNGRNPRNFELIYSYTSPVVYNSPIDGNNYQVVEGFGNEGEIRGDEQKNDFFILTGIRLTYILAAKKNK